ncbi:hypothetical protein [Archangium primigenium]|uniref:hypothetical protein n=1 Tax=[Archangium] primigenium TaxID=2792470 RepID=UPI00195EEBD0|nr:hypothetical protein [Archangium primigenium]MBM7118399.1 hypothetical protein [Archangium primigenium]
MLLALLGLTLLASTPPAPPPTSCLFVNGKTACGYACQRSVDDVRCASTPYGTCAMFQNKVYCFDPSLAAIHHPPDTGLRPECKAIGDEAACGFNCLVAQGKVACAQTPYGVCREHFGELKCWDPSEAIVHEFGAETPKPGYLTASTAIAFGYDCKANRAEVQCAATPRGRCDKNDFRIQCFDPPSLTHCAHVQPPDPAEVRKPKHLRKEAQKAESESAAR